MTAGTKYFTPALRFLNSGVRTGINRQVLTSCVHESQETHPKSFPRRARFSRSFSITTEPKEESKNPDSIGQSTIGQQPNDPSGSALKEVLLGKHELKSTETGQEGAEAEIKAIGSDDMKEPTLFPLAKGSSKAGQHWTTREKEMSEERSENAQDGQPRPSRQVHMPVYPSPDGLETPENALSVYDFTRVRPRVRLVYIRDTDHANTELDALLTAARKPWGARIAGLDCEWRPKFSPGPESPVALVQIALGSTILLIQVSTMREFPTKLHELLRNPTILKSGVGLLDDCKRLYRDYGVSTRGAIELAYLSRYIDADTWQSDTDPTKNKGQIGLARLVRAYKQLRLRKNRHVQLSNWEAVLNHDQQNYAANDAHVSMTLAVGLLARVPPDMDHHRLSFDLIDGISMRGNGHPWTEAIPEMTKSEQVVEPVESTSESDSQSELNGTEQSQVSSDDSENVAKKSD